MKSAGRFWLMVLGGLILISGGVYVWGKTRGLRNNNPGNIRHSAIKWKGMSEQQTDPAFVQFIDAKWGIRAMGKDLLGDFLDGQNTVRKLINEWAPPVENNTSAYVLAVAKALGVGPDDTLQLPAQLPRLVEAVIQHENGTQPYPEAMIRESLALA